MMENVTIKVEYQALTVEYSGPIEFVEDGLSNFCERIIGLNIAKSGKVKLIEDESTFHAGNDVSYTSTSDIAVKLGAKSGTDLVMCAAASLTFIQNVEVFKRADILTEMKTAKAFYKQTYSNNLSKSFETLIKTGRLSTPSHETYVLPHAEKEALSGQLGMA